LGGIHWKFDGKKTETPPKIRLDSHLLAFLKIQRFRICYG